ncbi:glutathione S-transferase family protein [Segnochrobactrum spirostomi]|uniref:Glutathione S-transferase family protein n=1 Tax=Segnochrobactrum spirostomi TaxID=2608987 RepID=A0A6A7XZZ3_9HYPH|nr:glutathione S-transferase family protein [Segnochrobactrum spirostomi]MQT11697.1 glutathione S-transferase family protein [Segnochrobactrum spirostomi]
MGQLVDGHWEVEEFSTLRTGGRFVRPASPIRHWITPDGAPGPTGEGGFKAEPGRYHLYVSLACPWAHRTLILRALKGLEAMISLSVVHWLMREDGWTFAPGPGVIPDPNVGARFLRDVYIASDAHYTGRVTTPVLWDKQTKRIVNNESADIIRMFNSAFDGVGAAPGDYEPVALKDEIDALNARIYDLLNNGVYKAGLARDQAAYEEAVTGVFAMLDELEARLAERRYLFGDRPTLADWRLFPTLVRFDAVYVGHFKCNLRRLVDYPNLWGYVRDLYAFPGVAGTVDLHHIKHHYYESHRAVNPSGVVPLGPVLDFTEPTGRAALAAG